MKSNKDIAKDFSNAFGKSVVIESLVYGMLKQAEIKQLKEMLNLKQKKSARILLEKRLKKAKKQRKKWKKWFKANSVRCKQPGCKRRELKNSRTVEVTMCSTCMQRILSGVQKDRYHSKADKDKAKELRIKRLQKKEADKSIKVRRPYTRRKKK